MEGGSIVYTKPFPPSFLIARQSHSHSRVPRSAAAAMFSGGGAETDKCDRFTRHERERERERKGEKLPRRAAHHVLMASLAHERVRRRGATREGGVLILLVSRMRRRMINVHEREKISETSSSSWKE